MSEKQGKSSSVREMSSAQMFDAMLAKASMIPHPHVEDAPPPRPLTRNEKASVRAKEIINAEAAARDEKTKRLRAARLSG